MDMPTALKETEKLSLDDQMELVERLWDRLVDSGWKPTLSDEKRAELDRRLDDLDANPANVVTWQEMIARLRNDS